MGTHLNAMDFVDVIQMSTHNVLKKNRKNIIKTSPLLIFFKSVPLLGRHIFYHKFFQLFCFVCVEVLRSSTQWGHVEHGQFT